nr:spore germination protein [uncultured Bacillus sp.]
MLLNPKDRITSAQAAVIVVNFILASGIMTLPRTVTEKVKTPDVWITVILGGLIAMIAGVIMVKLSQRFPDKTFYQYSQEIVGKWAGSVLSLVIVFYFSTLSAFEVRSMAEVTSFLLLEETPQWPITMTFMWVGLYLILGGINAIARLFEMILPITVIFFLLVTFMSFKIFEIDHLRPVLGSGFIPVLKGLKTTTIAYIGAEIMLLLLPFMKQPNKAVKVVLTATSMAVVFYVITLVMVIGGLSTDGVITRTWPTFDLIRSFELTGLIFERFESLLMVTWMMQIFSTFTITYYAAALGLAQLTNKNIHKFMFGLLPVIYFIAMYPDTINDLFRLSDWIGNVSIYLFFFLPLPLLIISIIKKAYSRAKSS